MEGGGIVPLHPVGDFVIRSKREDVPVRFDDLVVAHGLPSQPLLPMFADGCYGGVLRFVRIEYAGIAALPNSEINALTLGGVGSGTIVENVQTIYANDDAFEFFGGTVSARNLYAFATADDDFDFDFGYTGTITNGVAKRDPQFVDSGDVSNINSDRLSPCDLFLVTSAFLGIM